MNHSPALKRTPKQRVVKVHPHARSIKQWPTGEFWIVSLTRRIGRGRNVREAWADASGKL